MLNGANDFMWIRAHKTFNRPSHPRGWKALRRQVLQDADGICQYPNCLVQAEVVDHIINLASGGTHDRHNLQALCTPHHTRKTLAEARSARQYPTTTRPKDKHPGITDR